MARGMRILREIGITLLIAVAIFVPLKSTMQGYTVQYSSMLPSIEDGDWILVNKASYFFSDPDRGDVVVFDPGEQVHSEYPFIKRVIGLPGETIEIIDGRVYIDGRAIAEPYVYSQKGSAAGDFGPKHLRPDQYFVMGDNRDNSNDSRSWGPIDRDDIIGKANFVYWPPSKLGPVEHYSYPSLA